jgi:hypothetical protein
MAESDPGPFAGLNYLDRLAELLRPLRDGGRRRDAAGNRTLHFDQYCALLLLQLFNPILNSLRGLQRATALQAVRDRVGVAYVSLGSLSEAARAFDPEALAAVVRRLIDRLPDPGALTPEARAARRTLVAVDGTCLKALPQIARAGLASRGDRGWKLHVHFEVDRGAPVAVALTDASGAGDANEKAALRRSLRPGRCYVMDRGYEEFALFNAVVAAGSSYVCRVRSDRHFAATAPRELTPQARAAGVVEDAVGVLGSAKSTRIEHPDHPVRRVVVRADPHPRRGGLRRADPPEVVLATDLVDAPAEVIASIYRDRWAIELFFRTMKHLLGMRSLLSTAAPGVAIQTYCALIACLLITVLSGRRPTRRTWEMLCWHASGWASDAELARHLEAEAKGAKKRPF